MRLTGKGIWGEPCDHDEAIAVLRRVSYTLTVCDNGPVGSGSDFFQLFIPSQGFGVSGPVTSGDISKR